MARWIRAHDRAAADNKALTQATMEASAIQNEYLGGELPPNERLHGNGAGQCRSGGIGEDPCLAAGSST
jgi:hypothetical protein